MDMFSAILDSIVLFVTVVLLLAIFESIWRQRPPFR
jgi:hypothetical protein